MSLGRRDAHAKHENNGVQKESATLDAEYLPTQKVMTVDGFVGTVTAVYTTPFGGEEYDVILDGGMGGGLYTSSQLRNVPTQHEAIGVHVASDDYPVLKDILVERPDIANPRMAKKAAWISPLQEPTQHWPMNFNHLSPGADPSFNGLFNNRFYPGQRVTTFDGLTGTVVGFVGNGLSSFGGGRAPVFSVVLDNGMGGGEYAANDLRPETGVNTMILHQASDVTSGSQMDGSFDDTSAGDCGGADYHEQGGDLQTGASLRKKAVNEHQTVSEDSNDSWGHDGDDSTNVVTAGAVVEQKGHGMDPDHYIYDEYNPETRGGMVYPSSTGGEHKGYVPDKDSTKEYHPRPIVSLNSLDPDLRLAAQLINEAAVNNAWGEPEPSDIQLAPKPFGATQQRDPKANPGSTGWASQGDPEGWAGVGPGSFGYSTRMASIDQEMVFEAASDRSDYSDEMIFEAAVDQSEEGQTVKVDTQYEHAAPTLRASDPPHALLGEVPAPDLGGPGYPSGPKGGQGGAMPPAAPKSPEHANEDGGAEATLHDQPEGALPSTDGGLSLAEDAGGDEHVPTDDQEVTPARTASIESIVEEFQRTAGKKLMEGAPTAGGSEIAQAAREHLAKTALKDYSPSEQQAIINEGSNATAKNLDRLQLQGTHYLDDDNDEWMI